VFTVGSATSTQSIRRLKLVACERALPQRRHFAIEKDYWVAIFDYKKRPSLPPELLQICAKKNRMAVCRVRP
jgi:hypothetical protein